MKRYSLPRRLAGTLLVLLAGCAAKPAPPLPPPAPAPAPAPPVLAQAPVRLPRPPRYRVEPQGLYESPGAFTRLSYQSPEEFPEDPRFPSGGRLVLIIGRREARNAISRWFTFTLLEGDNQIFRRRGQEDIPYVPGNDELYWNNLEFDINTTWQSPLTFRIEDSFLNQTYVFLIIRDQDEP
ncbi:MAG: hypothetical protein LBQ61_04155 [Spirochaetales bacterium]|nr:hypothetical protein [Spirochaetales bacterium]